MGGATRFMTLLIAPSPPFRPSLNLLQRCLSTLSITPLRFHTLSSLSKSKALASQTASCFHSESGKNAFAQPSVSHQQQHIHHPWPEWTNFLDILSNVQGNFAPDGDRIPPEDAFVVYEKLTDDFVSAAAACIAFARARPGLIGLLSRRDIEAVVSNGTPFLFRSALDAARRMRAFLGTDGNNVSEVDRASTLDLMKYIISYARNPTISSEKNGLYSRELVDSSVRNLLHEMFKVCGGVPTGSMPASSPKPFGQNIEMKRGDWICQKCTFMNFARNIKCLECEEPRPKKLLTGREWECPQCNFFNYGRNVVCLRCDCRRPGTLLFNNNYSQNIGKKLSPVSQSGSCGSSNSSHVSSVSLPLDAFSRTGQTFEMDNGNKLPLQVNNTSSSDVRDRTTTSSKSQDSAGNFQFADDSASQTRNESKDREQSEKSERWFQRMVELQNVKDLPSAVSEKEFPEAMPMRKGENQFVISKQRDRSLTSPQYRRHVAIDQGNNTNFVPFVPFPPGYFATQDTEQRVGPDSPVKTVKEVPSSKIMEQTKKLDAKHRISDSSDVLRKDHNTMSSVDSRSSGETGVSDASRMHKQPTNSTAQFSGYNLSHPSGNTVQSSVASNTINSNSRTGGYSGMGDVPVAGNEGASSPLPKTETSRTGWSGTSLEGSAVKETDALDMSEEAKAERWFKRVAQIKDISELSQIPDEDFPSIMPMRKGVNRFVVSKRKTPLERRLTSQQYRRNVANNPVKKEGDNS